MGWLLLLLASAILIGALLEPTCCGRMLLVVFNAVSKRYKLRRLRVSILSFAIENLELTSSGGAQEERPCILLERLCIRQALEESRRKVKVKISKLELCRCKELAQYLDGQRPKSEAGQRPPKSSPGWVEQTLLHWCARLISSVTLELDGLVVEERLNIVHQLDHLRVQASLQSGSLSLILQPGQQLQRVILQTKVHLEDLSVCIREDVDCGPQVPGVELTLPALNVESYGRGTGLLERIEVECPEKVEIDCSLQHLRELNAGSHPAVSSTSQVPPSLPSTVGLSPLSIPGGTLDQSSDLVIRKVADHVSLKFSGIKLQLIDTETATPDPHQRIVVSLALTAMANWRTTKESTESLLASFGLSGLSCQFLGRSKRDLLLLQSVELESELQTLINRGGHILQNAESELRISSTKVGFDTTAVLFLDSLASCFQTSSKKRPPTSPSSLGIFCTPCSLRVSMVESSFMLSTGRLEGSRGVEGAEFSVCLEKIDLELQRRGQRLSTPSSSPHKLTFLTQLSRFSLSGAAFCMKLLEGASDPSFAIECVLSQMSLTEDASVAASRSPSLCYSFITKGFCIQYRLWCGSPWTSFINSRTLAVSCLCERDYSGIGLGLSPQWHLSMDRVDCLVNPSLQLYLLRCITAMDELANYLEDVLNRGNALEGNDERKVDTFHRLTIRMTTLRLQYAFGAGSSIGLQCEEACLSIVKSSTTLQVTSQMQILSLYLGESTQFGTLGGIKMTYTVDRMSRLESKVHFASSMCTCSLTLRHGVDLSTHLFGLLEQLKVVKLLAPEPNPHKREVMSYEVQCSSFSLIIEGEDSLSALAHMFGASPLQEDTEGISKLVKLAMEGIYLQGDSTSGEAGRESLLGRVHELDPSAVSLTSSDFQSLAGGDALLRVQTLSLRLGRHACDFLTLQSLGVAGTLIVAEERASFLYNYKKSFRLYSAEEQYNDGGEADAYNRRRLQVEVSGNNLPTKLVYSLQSTLQGLTVAFGPLIADSLSLASAAFDRVTPTNPGGRGVAATPWWDKLRYMLNGKADLQVTELTVFPFVYNSSKPSQGLSIKLHQVLFNVVGDGLLKASAVKSEILLNCERHTLMDTSVIATIPILEVELALEFSSSSEHQNYMQLYTSGQISPEDIWQSFTAHSLNCSIEVCSAGNPSLGTGGSRLAIQWDLVAGYLNSLYQNSDRYALKRPDTKKAGPNLLDLCRQFTLHINLGCLKVLWFEDDKSSKAVYATSECFLVNMTFIKSASGASDKSSQGASDVLSVAATLLQIDHLYGYLLLINRRRSSAGDPSAAAGEMGARHLSRRRSSIKAGISPDYLTMESMRLLTPEEPVRESWLHPFITPDPSAFFIEADTATMKLGPRSLSEIFALGLPYGKRRRLPAITGPIFSREDTQPIVLTNMKLLWTLEMRDEVFRMVEVVQMDLSRISSKKEPTLVRSHSLSDVSEAGPLRAEDVSEADFLSISDSSSVSSGLISEPLGDKVVKPKAQEGPTMLELLAKGELDGLPEERPVSDASLAPLDPKVPNWAAGELAEDLHHQDTSEGSSTVSFRRSDTFLSEISAFSGGTQSEELKELHLNHKPDRLLRSGRQSLDSYDIVFEGIQVNFMDHTSRSSVVVASEKAEMKISSRTFVPDLPAALEKRISVQFESLTGYIAPTDVDISAGIEWLEREVETGTPAVNRVADDLSKGAEGRRKLTRRPSGSRRSGLLKQILDESFARFSYTTYDISLSGNAPDRKDKLPPGCIDRLDLDIPEVSVSMDSNQFYQLLAVIKHVLLAPPSRHVRKRRRSSSGSLAAGNLQPATLQSLTKTDFLLINDTMNSLLTKRAKDERKELNRKEKPVKVVQWCLGKGRWSLIDSASSGRSSSMDFIEICFVGFQGKHTFYEDLSTLFIINAETARVNNKKPGPSSIVFKDPTGIITPNITSQPGANANTKRKESFLSIRATGSPPLNILGKKLSVYDHIEVNVFPGVNHVIDVQMTADVLGILVTYFFPPTETSPASTSLLLGPAPTQPVESLSMWGISSTTSFGSTSGEGGGEKPKKSKKGLMDKLKEKSRFKEKKSKLHGMDSDSSPTSALSLQSSTSRDSDDSSDTSVVIFEEDEDDFSDTTQRGEVFFFRYIRIGQLCVRVSCDGFPVNVDRVVLQVDPFVRQRRIWTWEKFVRKVVKHIIWHVTKSSATSGLSKVKHKLLRLGGTDRGGSVVADEDAMGEVQALRSPVPTSDDEKDSQRRAKFLLGSVK